MSALEPAHCAPSKRLAAGCPAALLLRLVRSAAREPANQETRRGVLQPVGAWNSSFVPHLRQTLYDAVQSKLYVLHLIERRLLLGRSGSAWTCGFDRIRVDAPSRTSAVPVGRYT